MHYSQLFSRDRALLYAEVPYLPSVTNWFEDFLPSLSFTPASRSKHTTLSVILRVPLIALMKSARSKVTFFIPNSSIGVNDAR